MARFVTSGIVLLAVIILTVGACAPAAPAPAPPVAPAPKPEAALSPEEAAWAPVVEAAKKEGKVAAYTSVLFTGPAGDALAKAFQRKYGITVEFISGTSGSQLERVQTEYRANKLATDFQGGSQTTNMILRDQGMLAPWGDLPSMAAKDVWFYPPRYDEQGTMVSWGKYWVASNVNTSLVKPEEEPKSYLDLLEPRWKGKMVAVEPGTPMLAVVYASLKYNKILDVDDYFRKLGAQNVRFFVQGIEGSTAVSRGEAAIYIAPHETYVNDFIAQGAPIKPVYFKEGIPLRNLMTLAFMKGAPHPNAARLLMNWMLSPEGETLYAREKKTSPIRRDVPDFSATSKVIAPQAKTFFTQNEWIDKEGSRVVREKVLHKLLGLEK